MLEAAQASTREPRATSWRMISTTAVVLPVPAAGKIMRRRRWCPSEQRHELQCRSRCVDLHTDATACPLTWRPVHQSKILG